MGNSAKQISPLLIYSRHQRAPAPPAAIVHFCPYFELNLTQHTCLSLCNSHHTHYHDGSRSFHRPEKSRTVRNDKRGRRFAACVVPTETEP